jgi:alkanesulfonate monooxygenase SsuD/methylene tetrahydromethanopterin reductase-like flavin-dependent oxidoreductase (luciferase family)
MHLGLARWQPAATDVDPGDLLRLSERADRLGLDSIWFNEYHFRRSGLPQRVGLWPIVRQSTIRCRPPRSSPNWTQNAGVDCPTWLRARSRGTRVLRRHAGSPENCIHQLQNLARTTGITHVRCVFIGNGELTPSATLGAMELFAAEVLPACRAINRSVTHSHA